MALSTTPVMGHEAKLSFGDTTTKGEVTSANAETFDLEPTQTLTIKINGGGAATVTFDAAAAELTASAGSFAQMSNESMEVRVDGGEWQTITFGTEASMVLALAVLNAAIEGASAHDNAGEDVDIVSDTKGTSSKIETQNVDVGIETKLGIDDPGDSGAGTGDVADINAVTAAEVAARISADVAGGTGIANAAGTVTAQTDTSGAGGSVQVTGGTANTAIAFDTGVYAGSGSSAAKAIQPFTSESLQHVVERLDNSGIRGTRSLEEKMSVSGPTRNGGSLSIIPNRLQLEDWLPFIMGLPEVSDEYKLTEAIKDTLAVKVWRGSGGDDFGSGAVNRATFRGTAGGLLEIELDLLFQSWSDLAADPADSLDAGLPYAYSGFVFTWDTGGTPKAYRIKEFELTIDHMLADDHRNNAVDVQEFPTGGREVRLAVVMPYSAASEALKAKVMEASAGELIDYGITLVCTAPDSHTLTITAGRALIETGHANVGSKEAETDVRFEMLLQASTTRNDELVIKVED